MFVCRLGTATKRFRLQTVVFRYKFQTVVLIFPQQSIFSPFCVNGRFSLLLSISVIILLCNKTKDLLRIFEYMCIVNFIDMLWSFARTFASIHRCAYVKMGHNQPKGAHMSQPNFFPLPEPVVSAGSYRIYCSESFSW